MNRPRRPFRPQEILRVLHEHDVQFVLIGGMAASAHGSPHLTNDADICPRSKRDNLERLATALRRLRARIRSPDGKLGRKVDLDPGLLELAEVWNLDTRAGNLDLVFLPAGTRGYGELLLDATTVTMKGIPVATASLADVIRSKEAAGRPKDLLVLGELRELLARTRRRRLPGRPHRRGV